MTRDQLRENALLKKYNCDVNINDLINFNEELAHKLASEPAEVVPLVSNIGKILGRNTSDGFWLV